MSCNNKIIDGTELEEINKHYKKGCTLIDDDRKGIEFLNGRQPESKKEETTYVEYAKQVFGQCFIRTLEDNNEILYYENGVYVSNGENKIKKILLQINPDLRIHEIKEIIEKIKQITYTPRVDFDVNEFQICVNNGILDVRTGQLTSHNPSKLFRTRIPVTFDPKARSVKFVKFLQTALPLPWDYIDKMEAFSTGLIKNSPKLESLFFETGAGNNGKSTFFTILNWFYGKENYSTVSIHDFIKNRFAKARLENKLINTFPDIENDSLDNFGLLKALVSGDEIDIERKYENPYSFVNHAKMFFSANELPEIKEKTFATFKRIRLTQWTQIFVKSELYLQQKAELGTKFPEFSDLELENELARNGIHKMNRQFVDDILSDENEKSGILNLLLVVVRHLIKRDDFFNHYDVEDIQDNWSKNSTVIESFAKECFVTESDTYVIKSEVYQIYYNYCKAKNKPPKSANVFHPLFQAQMSGLEDSKKRINKREVRIYQGIKWNISNQIVHKFVTLRNGETDETSCLENYSK
ncbi:MAG TPA: phage/plasmid primase, P4 family [Candidatus Nitrosotalea sp.]|nr:phage/plasmid primase, P4 family [Candidatus Nitrosotalea sp.]